MLNSLTFERGLSPPKSSTDGLSPRGLVPWLWPMRLFKKTQGSTGAEFAEYIKNSRGFAKCFAFDQINLTSTVIACV